MQKFWVTIASGFGLGFLKPGPGTWGSLGALALFMVLRDVVGWGFVMLALTCLFLLFLGTLSIQKSTPFFKKDDGRIVIDEWVGMGIAFLGASPAGWQLLLSFILFRAFDIIKPFGVRYFDRQNWSGWDVMLDDVVAGLYALAVMLVLNWGLIYV